MSTFVRHVNSSIENEEYISHCDLLELLITQIYIHEEKWDISEMRKATKISLEAHAHFVRFDIFGCKNVPFMTLQH